MNIDHVVREHVRHYPRDGRALYDEVIRLAERPLLELVLHEAHGCQQRAAQILGINRNTLRKKLRAHGLLSANGRTEASA